MDKPGPFDKDNEYYKAYPPVVLLTIWEHERLRKIEKTARVHVEFDSYPHQDACDSCDGLSDPHPACTCGFDELKEALNK